jgi:hypothetical protein
LGPPPGLEEPGPSSQQGPAFGFSAREFVRPLSSVEGDGQSRGRPRSGRQRQRDRKRRREQLDSQSSSKL